MRHYGGLSDVWADQEEQEYTHGPDGGHDIARCVSDHVLDLQRRLLAVLPALNDVALHGLLLV